MIFNAFMSNKREEAHTRNKKKEKKTQMFTMTFYLNGIFELTFLVSMIILLSFSIAHTKKANKTFSNFNIYI